MSIRVTTYVWDHSEQCGSALLLMLAIADHAHDDGGGAYPSIARLAKKARTSERNVKLLLKKLKKEGELEIEHCAGPRGVNIYRVKKFHPQGPEGETQRQRGEAQGQEGVKSVSPKPSLEPSVKPSDFTEPNGSANCPQQNGNGKKPNAMTILMDEYNAAKEQGRDPLVLPDAKRKDLAGYFRQHLKEHTNEDQLRLIAKYMVARACGEVTDKKAWCGFGTASDQVKRGWRIGQKNGQVATRERRDYDKYDASPEADEFTAMLEKELRETRSV